MEKCVAAYQADAIASTIDRAISGHAWWTQKSIVRTTTAVIVFMLGSMRCGQRSGEFAIGFEASRERRIGGDGPRRSLGRLSGSLSRFFGRLLACFLTRHATWYPGALKGSAAEIVDIFLANCVAAAARIDAGRGPLSALMLLTPNRLQAKTLPFDGKNPFSVQSATV